MQILHLVPLPVGLVEYVDAIGALLGITVVHNVRDQIVFGILDRLVALLHAQNIAKVYVSARKKKQKVIRRRMRSISSTYLMGKLTIVGFFSRKKVFLVKRLMYRIMNCGSRVISNRFIKLSLYVLYSFSALPLNLPSN